MLGKIVFLVLAILMDVKWYLIVVLINIFLLSNELFCVLNGHLYVS